MGRPLADVILPGHGHVVRGYLPWHDDVPTLSHDVFHIVSEGRIEGEPDGELFDGGDALRQFLGGLCCRLQLEGALVLVHDVLGRDLAAVGGRGVGKASTGYELDLQGALIEPIPALNHLRVWRLELARGGSLVKGEQRRIGQVIDAAFV